MRILHISLGLPPYRTGGMTKYSLDLMTSQKELGHEVSLVYPGHYTWSGVFMIRKNRSYQGIQVYEIVNPLPVPLLGGIKEPERFMRTVDKARCMPFLKHVQPDVIHVHTMMGIHKEFLEAAKECGIKLIFTSHDYFGICPRVNLVKADGNFCKSFDQGGGCIACNQAAYSLPMIHVMQSRPYRYWKSSPMVTLLRKRVRRRVHSTGSPLRLPAAQDNDPFLSRQYLELRKYYLEMFRLIDRIHFNSSVAKEEYEKYTQTPGDVISIRHADLEDQRTVKIFPKQDEPLRFTYLGPVDLYKGFFLLQQSLQQLEQRPFLKWELHVYGDDAPADEQLYPERFIFHGRYQYEDLPGIFGQTDVLIIPSIGKETFGFVGLEALSHGVPIVVSDQTGFKDMIRDGVTGWLFKPEVNELSGKLLHILNHRELLAQVNAYICEQSIHFSMKRHAREINEWYSTVEKEVSYVD